MTVKHSPLAIAVLNFIKENDSANFLEIEKALNISQGLHRINTLMRQGHIQSLPKERGELKRYALTPSGEKLIFRGLKKQEQRCGVMDLPQYIPTEMKASVRPGAMDAFGFPSRMSNSLHYRDGRVEVIA